MAITQTEEACEIEPPLSQKGKISFEEFLEWCDEDTWAEWVDGEVIMLSPASTQHQDIAGFLESILRIYTEEHQLGKVLNAPFLMRLPSLPRGREPDLLFIATEHLDRLQETYLDGPADVVIEIVSEDSIARDREKKFFEYERAGILEYWLLDPLRKEAIFYQLSEEGRYCSIALEADEIYRSQVIRGFWLRVSWLWREPLPRVSTVLREILGESLV